MRTWLRHIWEVVGTSYWFVPAVLTAAAVLLSGVALEIDRRWPTAEWFPGVLYSGSPAGARALLAAIAGSMITVAGVVFSITVATLTQASSQFGPRLLRNFMRDRMNQVTLGTFTATFVYCLLVVRAVRGTDDGAQFVPSLATSTSVLLALLCIGVLIGFIHHASRGLQAPVVVANAARELLGVIARDVDRADDTRGEGALEPDIELAAAHSAGALRTGYVQAIRRDVLVGLAQKHGVVIDLRRRAGDFLSEGLEVAVIRPAERSCADLARRVADAMIVGIQSTPEEDIGFFIRQLTEIAARALSPGINDPYTAAECVDWLGAAIEGATRRRDARRIWKDGDGAVRVLDRGWTFAEIVDESLGTIRRSAGPSSVIVLDRMLDRIARVGEAARTPAQRGVLRAHVVAIEEQVKSMTLTSQDRDLLLAHVGAALEHVPAE